MHRFESDRRLLVDLVGLTFQFALNKNGLIFDDFLSRIKHFQSIEEPGVWGSSSAAPNQKRE